MPRTVRSRIELTASAKQQAQDDDARHDHKRKVKGDAQRLPEDLVAEEFTVIGQRGELKDARSLVEEAPIKHLQNRPPHQADDKDQREQQYHAAQRMFG